MTPEESDKLEATVNRVLSVLREFTLLKRELDWYRHREPVVYGELYDKLRKAIHGSGTVE